jgi:RNA polymerase sigma factor (sigma-70 family)
MWLEVRPSESSARGWTPTVVAPSAPTESQHPVAKPSAELRAANAAALRDLYQRDLRMLQTVVRRVVRSPTDAEDVVHDAFLRVWRAMEGGLVRSPRAVLFKTAYHLALNHVRSPRNQSTDAPPSAEPTHDAPTAEEQMIVDEDLQACRQTLDRLPLRCRETMTLRVVEEMSYKEMSDKLGLSVSTLEKHFIRGRRLCRDILRSGVEHERAGAILRRRPSRMLAAAE